MNNKRLFPRSNVSISIYFDFVKWKERRVNRCKNTFKSTAYDISAQGVGLIDLPDINESLRKELYTGKKKIRLTFLLDPDKVLVYSFARLVWDGHNVKEVKGNSRYGFEFIDISNDAFNEINSFVENNAEK